MLCCRISFLVVMTLAGLHHVRPLRLQKCDGQWIDSADSTVLQWPQVLNTSLTSLLQVGALLREYGCAGEDHHPCLLDDDGAAVGVDDDTTGSKRLRFSRCPIALPLDLPPFVDQAWLAGQGRILEGGQFDTADTVRVHTVDRNLTQALRAFFSSGNYSVMDLGCGNGFYSQALHAVGVDVVCFDGNPHTPHLTGGLCQVGELHTDKLRRQATQLRKDWVLSLEASEPFTLM